VDFGLVGERPVREVLEHWRSFRQQMGWGFQSIVVGHQCHGTRLVIHETPAADWQVPDDADGHLSARPGILLTLTVAD
jgi:copper oxidase (laccase) domain-containing protein